MPGTGAVLGLGGLLPVATTVMVTTMARDTSHPNTKAAPFQTPRLEGSTTMNAVSGSGSSATAKPIRIRLRTTSRQSHLPRLTLPPTAAPAPITTTSWRLFTQNRQGA